jgi:hypothetical protein
MVSQLAVPGGAVDEEVMKKYLRIVPEKYEQVAVSIETMLDLKTISIEARPGGSRRRKNVRQEGRGQGGAHNRQQRATLHTCRVVRRTRTHRAGKDPPPRVATVAARHQIRRAPSRRWARINAGGAARPGIGQRSAQSRPRRPRPWRTSRRRTTTRRHC